MSKGVTELWAVIDHAGRVLWSRGGSSTKPHLLVYPDCATAERALSNSWMRQVIPDRDAVRVVRIYQRGGEE